RSTDAACRADIREAGPRWYERYHSEDVVAGRLLNCIQRCVEPTSADLVLHALREQQADLLLIKYGVPGYGVLGSRTRLVGAHHNFLNSAPVVRFRLSMRRLRHNYPILGGAVFHALYWPTRAFLWSGRKLKQRLCRFCS